MLRYFPKYFAERSVVLYIITILVLLLLFFNARMPIYLYVFGIVSVVIFFYGSNSLINKWACVSTKQFKTNLYKIAFIIRLIYVIFIYMYNYHLYGTFYESNDGDIGWYVPAAIEGAKLLGEGVNVIDFWRVGGIEYSDMGYILYLSMLYLFSGSISTVILPLIIKSILGALVCVSIYRIGVRHFGESTGRMAGIFCALQFNMIWWCGSMMKETEMCFLLAYFIERADNILYGNKKNMIYIIITLLFVIALYFFRTSLSICALMSFLIAVLFTENKLFTRRYKIILLASISFVLLVTIGGRIYNEFGTLINRAISDHQQTNMEWRVTREGGNSFAKYAGAAVFAPLILTIPFPSMTYTYLEQEMQMQVSGGNFVKNIMSFFVIIFLFSLSKNKQWKKHIFLVAVLLSYLLALVLSEFAQSGRFHMPILGLEMLFAAAGVTYLGKSAKRYFNYVLIFELIVIIGWNWFKLAGRGLA